MQNIEKVFWKYFTHLGQVPIILIPIGGIYFFSGDLNLTLHLCLFIGIAMFLGLATKILFFKDRPNPVKYKNIVQKSIAGSFPSIHTTNTFSMFIFSTLLGVIPLVIYGLFSFMIMYSRVYLKKHFWSDILGGIIYVTILFIVYYNFVLEIDLISLLGI